MNKNSLLQAMSMLVGFMPSRFGLPKNTSIRQLASVESLKGTYAPKVSSKTYRPRNQRKHGGRHGRS